MQSQSARQALTAKTIESRRSLIRITLIAVFLLAGALLSSAARAANEVIDCDRLASDLRSLDVPATELPLDDIDHMTSDPARNLVVLDAAELLEQAAPAPVLLLTPRVASIMREVFDALPVIAIDDGTVDDASGTDAELAELPPGIEAPQRPLAVFPGDRDADDDDGRLIPKFQRQMYRTDI